MFNCNPPSAPTTPKHPFWFHFIDRHKNTHTHTKSFTHPKTKTKKNVHFMFFGPTSGFHFENATQILMSCFINQLSKTTTYTQREKKAHNFFGNIENEPLSTHTQNYQGLSHVLRLSAFHLLQLREIVRLKLAEILIPPQTEEPEGRTFWIACVS